MYPGTQKTTTGRIGYSIEHVDIQKKNAESLHQRMMRWNREASTNPSRNGFAGVIGNMPGMSNHAYASYTNDTTGNLNDHFVRN